MTRFHVYCHPVLICQYSTYNTGRAISTLFTQTKPKKPMKKGIPAKETLTGKRKQLQVLTPRNT